MAKPHLFDQDFTGAIEGIYENPDEVVIPGVSVITEGPAEGHFATIGEGDAAKQLQMWVDGTTVDQVIAASRSYANGVKVKANHRTGVEAIFGRLTDFKEGLTKDGKKKATADFHLFKSYAFFPQMLHIVKNLTDAVGFSAFFDGDDVIMPDRCLARCSELYSVDLVGEPAANPSGVFGRKVDKLKEDQGDETMTPEELATACSNAMKPHMDAMHARLSKIEENMAKTPAPGASAATGGAPNNPSDDEAQYAKFLGRIVADPKVKALITGELQETAKTLHALGLVPGTGPASSIEKVPAKPGTEKKVEDMTFLEIIEHEFSKTENASKPDYEIIRAVTLAHPAKHRLALQFRDPQTNERTGLAKMPVRKVPYKAPAAA